ncbi:MAG: HIT family protein [Candidatus Nomurabacteria bacterium]|nr:HIT family protein [Candidatus Nomurabacteria bacterium]USN88215.1 MAG: HIT family protein [Candidatus Nomurabacteria bacterium]
MYSHKSAEYKNPFQAIIDNGNFDSIHTNKEDIFYQDNDISAFISSKQWPNNPGNVIIIPNTDYENIYDIPDNLLAKIHIFSKKVAIAMKELYKCDGVSIRQHNEPAGNQEVWHYHLHVFPRYEGDDLYSLHKQSFSSDPVSRAEFATKLKDYFNNNN